jgi:hypothetical protein
MKQWPDTWAEELCKNSVNPIHGQWVGLPTLRRSVLSIALGQLKGRYSLGVTCSGRSSGARRADRSLLTE